MDGDAVDRYFQWINERHRIFIKKDAGMPWPWTKDPILQTYKFTNAFRELDRTTQWMRNRWTGEWDTRPLPEIMFNVCFFRMFGTMEFAGAHGWVHAWDAKRCKEIARRRLEQGQKVFTGAYIITNQGLKEPKEQVVADYFLSPIWANRHDITQNILLHNSLQSAHQILGQYQGWGGGGFMAYEAVTDFNYTPLLLHPTDRLTWANAGPGAKRGLNRIYLRDLEFTGKHDWNGEMRELLGMSWQYLEKHISPPMIDMRMIEHCLCEWDKYERTRLGEGRPRSLYRQHSGG